MNDYTAPDYTLAVFSVCDVLTVSNPIVIQPRETTTEATTSSSVSIGGGKDGTIDFSDIFG